jgi:hypothetical protein
MGALGLEAVSKALFVKGDTCAPSVVSGSQV